jgi:glutamine amidotransferase
MRMLHQKGLTGVLKEQSARKPLLGICLGMQMLLGKGYEFEECEGLNLIPGTVEKLDVPGLIIPHMGWNKLEIQNPCPLLQDIGEEPYVYFVHSYAARCGEQHLAAYCEYGGKVPAMVYDGGNVFGAQFHPEKSGDVGLQILRNFGGLV